MKLTAFAVTALVAGATVAAAATTTTVDGQANPVLRALAAPVAVAPNVVVAPASAGVTESKADKKKEWGTRIRTQRLETPVRIRIRRLGC